MTMTAYLQIVDSCCQLGLDATMSASWMSKPQWLNSSMIPARF